MKTVNAPQKNMPHAEILAHSVSPVGDEIVTFKLRYWRAIHGEFMTHRVFGRNASSSRAIPVKRMLAQVWSDPAGPIHWGCNRPGMQADRELSGWRQRAAKTLWRMAGKAACVFAWGFCKIGLHKQVANRILEPWQYITVVVTATEWDNFFALRCHPDAQPEIQELAESMRAALAASTPRQIGWGGWHLPFVADETDTGRAIKRSVARCARTSYDSFDGQPSPYSRDSLLYDMLMCAEPRHASPAEHQATPRVGQHRNLRGWVHHRQLVEEKARWSID